MAEFVEITKDHYISKKGIMSIKVERRPMENAKYDIVVKYINGDVELIDPEVVSVEELLHKLGRSLRG